MPRFTTPFDASAVAPIPTAATRFAMIPPEMKDSRSWLVSTGGKKKPFPVRNGKVIVDNADTGARWKNPDYLCSYEEVLEAVEHDPSLNLMFVLGVGNDFICLDLDPMEKVAPSFVPMATRLREALASALIGFTYCERSISGRGLHYIGRGTDVRHHKEKLPVRDVELDLLFTSCLLITGNAVNDCTETPDISEAANNLLRDFAKKPVARPTVDTKVTPYISSETRLRAIIGNGVHGHAFRTGECRDVSQARIGIIHTLAEFCTDERRAYSVLTNSPLMQIDDGRGETRLAKMERLWPEDWKAALATTEANRRQRALSEGQDGVVGDLTRECLSEQSDYVNYRVQHHALSLLQQAVMRRHCDTDALAPIVGYLERGVRDLGEVRDVFEKRDKQRAVERLLEIQMAFEAFGDDFPESAEMNRYMMAMVLEEAQIDRRNVFRKYKEMYHIIENYGGKKMVFLNRPDGFTGAYACWTEPEFVRARRQDKVLAGWDENGAPIIGSAAQTWLDSPMSPRYFKREMCYGMTERVVMQPEGRVLNTFEGWGTQPVAGQWPAIHYLIRDIVCAGNDTCEAYVLDYLAHMVQQPSDLPGTAIILQSEEQGTGKSTFVEILRELFGPKYCGTTADADTFVGQFNSAAKDKLLLHFEEAVAPNDRKLESKIKALITNETLSYNAKGIAAVEARNCARIFMTSNAAYVAHLARHDRRMFVLKVSPKHAEDRAFWGQFRATYKAELSAFMHHLWTRDIGHFKATRIPYTAGRDEQKMESATGPDRILRELLREGILPIGSELKAEGWAVRANLLHEHFVRQGYAGKGLSARGGSAAVKPVTTGAKNARSTINGFSSVARHLFLPPLPEARQMFLDHMGIQSFDWGDDSDDWATA
ncbi:DUF5906 domain-containing protein [Ruegeria sp.]|uniref:DUF5906 domain-containing protein n=1 Tax=Ruegeria sp. TaxID=1879320 RepID=UPI003B5CFAA9